MDEVIADEIIYCLTCGKPELYPVKLRDMQDLKMGQQVPVEETDYIRCNACGSIWQMGYLVSDLRKQVGREGRGYAELLD